MITDLVMPRMGGQELAQLRPALRPSLRTVFLPGYIDDESVRLGIEEDATAFLQKPFSLAVLARKLRELLGPSYCDS